MLVVQKLAFRFYILAFRFHFLAFRFHILTFRQEGWTCFPHGSGAVEAGYLIDCGEGEARLSGKAKRLETKTFNVKSLWPGKLCGWRFP